MCTVTYLPLKKGFVLTHNRDEAPSRSPDRISAVPGSATGTLLFPKDTKAGGAWIVAADDGRTACLLNGAFVKHHHQPPYRRSRGLVLLDFFDWSDPASFFEAYDLDEIEPFTFLYFEHRGVVEFRWDGQRRHRADLPPGQAHFWCSSTLYPPAIQQQREQIFRTWLQAHHGTDSDDRLIDAVQELHLTGSVGDPENDYVMNRANRVRTVSMTQVVSREGRVRMRYSDLLEGQSDVCQLDLLPHSGRLKKA